MSSDTSPAPAESATPPVTVLADWVCPACRGVTGTEPGTCPQCGVALERIVLAPAETDPELRPVTRRFWLALALLVPLIGMGVVKAIEPDNFVSVALGDNLSLLLQAVFCAPMVFICAGPILLRAWRSIRTRRPTLDTLLGLSISAAFVYSLVALVYAWSDVRPLSRPSDVHLRPAVERGVQVVAPDQRGTADPFFESVGMLVLLGLVGQVLELRARERSGVALRKLARLAPSSVRVALPDGSEEERAVEAIQPGDLVRVRPGERIPVDGVIREGTSTIDESMLTGEPTRAGRGPGGRVLAGSENGLRPITVEATRAGPESVLGQVIGLIGRAQERRAGLQRTTDRLAAWYVPAVLLIAFATFVGWAVFGPGDSALTYASVCSVGVLVVACPRAVGLATAAVVVGMRRAADAGILFRDAGALEALAAVDTVVFDKTGTLTEGRPRLVAIVPNAGVSENAVLALAAAVERGCEHPLALAIVWEAARRGLDIATAENVEYVLAQGVRGTVDGQRIAVGRLGFIQESGTYTDLMPSEAMTHRQLGRLVVFVGEGLRCAGLIVMDDAVRAGALTTTGQLRLAGIKILMVTGDHADTAQGVARSVGIDVNEVVADALPVEKFAIVQKLKGEGRVVAMCGDGVNDAPALVAADVGIALGSGSGAAISTAGLTLVGSDLRLLTTARLLSRATVRALRQNLVLAFTLNVLAIPVAAGVLVPLGGGLINSVWATATMSISALVVLANSYRPPTRPSQLTTLAPAPGALG